MAKATGVTYKVAYRRRRKNLTNYTKRLGLIKGETPRLVVRCSGRHVIAQLVEFHPKGDKVLLSVHSSELSKHGWLPEGNTPTAYLVGIAAGARGKKAGIKGFHLDIGISTPSVGNSAYAAALGAKEAGLSCNIEPDRISQDRLAGKHIAEYAKKLKSEDSGKFQKQFSKYIKANIDVTQLDNILKGVKSKVSN